LPNALPLDFSPFGGWQAIFEVDDPASILWVLRDIERELIAFRGASDPELVEAVAMVQRSFAGARLVDVRKPRK
jgi:hypothetical protein